MRRIVLATTILATFVVLTVRAQDDPQAVVNAAAQALGAATLTSLQYSGSGTIDTFGQNWKNDVPWPEFNLTSYTATVDYSIPAMQVQLTRDNPDRGKPMQGGGFPLAALQNLNQVVSGKLAWNAGGENATPALAAVNDRLLELWSTPHGAIKAAQAAGAKVKAEAVKNASGESTGATTLTFPMMNTTFKVNVTKDHLVSRVEYQTDTPMLGDTTHVMLYSNYQDFGGVKFPGRIAHVEGENPQFKLAGFPIMTLTVSKVTPNAKVPVVPQNVQQAAAAPPPSPLAVKVDKIAEGVYFLSGQGANSVAVEFSDHIVLIEAPQNDALTTARFDAVRKTIPNKPVRYVISTHHHFDHAGGLRAAVAEGATIISHGLNQQFYEKVVQLPHTVNPDRLAKEPKKTNIEYVGTAFGAGRDERELTDGKRKLEIYRVTGSQHADDMLMGYLPAEKILVEADLFTPQTTPTPLAVTARPPEAGAGGTVAGGGGVIIDPEPRNLYNNIQRLKLQVETIAPLHGSVVKLAELLKILGVPSVQAAL